METIGLQKGQEVYELHMGQIVKGTIEDIYETAISISYETTTGTQRLMTYNWYLTLDEALNFFIARVNKTHGAAYRVTEIETNTLPVLRDISDVNLRKDERGICVEVIGSGQGHSVLINPKELQDIKKVGKALFYLGRSILEHNKKVGE